MGEDLKRVNKAYQKLITKIKTKHKITKEMESLLYLFFIAGFAEGSGMTQILQWPNKR